METTFIKIKPPNIISRGRNFSNVHIWKLDLIMYEHQRMRQTLKAIENITKFITK